MPSFDVTLAANTPFKLPGGNHFMVLESSADLTVKFFKDGNELVSERATNIEQGYTAHPEPTSPSNRPVFDSCELLSGSIQSVKVAVTMGRAEFLRVSGTVDVNVLTETKGTDLVNAAVTVGTTSTAILAAGTGRRKVSLFNNSPTETVYISDGAATVAGGYPIAPLTEKVIDQSPNAAINGITAENNADVRYLVEEQS